jgi:hypothetical protein
VPMLHSALVVIPRMSDAIDAVARHVHGQLIELSYGHAPRELYIERIRRLAHDLIALQGTQELGAPRRGARQLHKTHLPSSGAARARASGRWRGGATRASWGQWRALLIARDKHTDTDATVRALSGNRCHLACGLCGNPRCRCGGMR